MSEKYKAYDGGTFFVTLTVAGWIDVFTRREYADCIEQNLNYCIDKKGLTVYAYCIMPSHLHMIARVEKGLLTSVLRDFKSFTAKTILAMIETHPAESRREWLLYMFEYFANKIQHNQQYNFWQQYNHPIDLWYPAIMQQKLDYIHLNPVAAGIVNEPQYYVFSSANPACTVRITPV